MITLRPAGERGHANHGWLDSRFTFSFADYHDPAHMGFRSLRVINDDHIAPGMGFGMHPHRDMEIISYVLAGALEHRDSMGNGRVIRAGDFQYMAAGTGVRHSEFNPSQDEGTHLLQMWILPNHAGVPPAYAEKSARELATGTVHVIASGRAPNDAMPLNQDAELLLVKLGKGDTVRHALDAKRHAWVHVAEGELELNGQRLAAGDGASVTGESALDFTGLTAAQALVFDLA